MSTTRDDLMDALREAGADLVREHHEATGEVPTHLADEVTLQGDIDYLDEVAREHGLEDGMTEGYSRPLSDEWSAVFEGVRDALEELEETDTQKLLGDLTLTLADISERSGIPLDTLKSWSSGRAEPRLEGRRELEAWARKHVEKLERAASTGWGREERG